VTTRLPISASIVLDPSYSQLKEHVIESTGLAYYLDKDSDLAERISRRLPKVGLSDCDSYLHLLRDGDNGDMELDELIAELTIGETYFFRYREQFEALQYTVLPELIARNQTSRRLRIWSAGCATGAEAYSIAILLRREFSESLAGWDVSIIGTDINRAFLTRARTGEFEEWAFRSTPDELKWACFQRAGDRWVINPEYKDGVGFQYHNLVKHPFPSLINNLCSFDLILCRNAMIYFSRDIMRRLIAQFHHCLVDNGWLLVGHAEPSPDLFTAFEIVNAPGTILFRKGPGFAAPIGQNAAVELPSTWMESLRTVSSVPIIVPARIQAEPVPAPAENAVDSALPQLSDVCLLADQGQWENAARCSQRLLETDGLNPRAHFYYSLVLEQMGLHDEAERSLRRAVYLDRSFALAHYYLGLVLQKKNDRRGSERSFENVRTLVQKMDAGVTFEDAHEITAHDLMRLTETHLEVLRRS
jgi:chemotaxis protein methyltransferase CheR